MDYSGLSNTFYVLFRFESSLCKVFKMGFHQIDIESFLGFHKVHKRLIKSFAGADGILKCFVAMRQYKQDLSVLFRCECFDFLDNPHARVKGGRR